MAIPLTENFESYSTGDLQGQGSWTSPSGTGVGIVVSTQTPKTGSQCVKCSGVANKRYYKAVTNVLATGTEIFYVNLTSTPATGDGYGVIFDHSVPGTDPGSGYVFRVQLDPTSSSLYNINIQLTVAAGGTSTRVATGLSVGNTWHKIQVDWDNSVPNVKVTVDDSSNATVSLSAFTDISYISIWSSGDVGDQFLVDDFGGIATPTATSGTNNWLLMGV